MYMYTMYSHVCMYIYIYMRCSHIQHEHKRYNFNSIVVIKKRELSVLILSISFSKILHKVVKYIYIACSNTYVCICMYIFVQSTSHETIAEIPC